MDEAFLDFQIDFKVFARVYHHVRGADTRTPLIDDVRTDLGENLLSLCASKITNNLLSN